VLSRLGRTQSNTIVEQITREKALPVEIVRQIVAKTDGVPLFVEELTKAVVESGLHVGATHASPLALAIPATLHDSLMARLDRLGAAKEIAQVGAVLGREFSYELLYAVSSVDEDMFQHGLRQLVEAELVYQSGLPPQARYLFKHALVQETAYQSLLKSRRQQLHKQVAQVLAEQFPQTVETQPELVAHHYTEAGLGEQAIPYWQQAGQKAIEHSAYAEAISHITKGLELFKTQRDTPEHAQQELALQIALGGSLAAIKGYAAPEVEKVYAQARELCLQLGEIPQLFPTLWGLMAFYLIRAKLQTARELAEQMRRLAQSVKDLAHLQVAHWALGEILFYLGEWSQARAHLEQGIFLYDPQKRFSRALHDPGVSCLSIMARALWHSGYPDQALTRSHEALALAQDLSHPFSMAFALHLAAIVHRERREVRAAQERAEALIALSREHGFAFREAVGIILQGWVLVKQGQGEEGIAQIRAGLAAWQSTGAEVSRTYYLALLAEAYGKARQPEEGLSVLAEALDVVDKTGERYYEAELYRLKGTFTLQSQASPKQVSGKSQANQDKPEIEQEAEACFLKAVEIARRQQAKLLELRAATSLTRLWQHQGKQKEAHQMLAEIYGWFTEGFDTKDLQEAKTLLTELSH
jgi:predicted ATPase